MKPYAQYRSNGSLWRAGNTILGLCSAYNHATNPSTKSLKQAEKIIKGLLQTIPKGWKVTVRERDTSIIDLPAGFVYSIHP